MRNQKIWIRRFWRKWTLVCFSLFFSLFQSLNFLLFFLLFSTNLDFWKEFSSFTIFLSTKIFLSNLKEMGLWKLSKNFTKKQTWKLVFGYFRRLCLFWRNPFAKWYLKFEIFSRNPFVKTQKPKGNGVMKF